MTPLDCLRYHFGEMDPEYVAIVQVLLQTYAEMLAQREGLLCIHSVLQEVTITEDNQYCFKLSVGRLSVKYLQILLELLIAKVPGSICALNDDGLLPLQTACQLNFPDQMIYMLLRPCPDALLSL